MQVTSPPGDTAWGDARCGDRPTHLHRRPTRPYSYPLQSTEPPRAFDPHAHPWPRSSQAAAEGPAREPVTGAGARIDAPTSTTVTSVGDLGGSLQLHDNDLTGSIPRELAGIEVGLAVAQFDVDQAGRRWRRPDSSLRGCGSATTSRVWFRPGGTFNPCWLARRRGPERLNGNRPNPLSRSI